MLKFEKAMHVIKSVLSIATMAIGVIGEGNQLVKEMKGGKRK